MISSTHSSRSFFRLIRLCTLSVIMATSALSVFDSLLTQWTACNCFFHFYFGLEIAWKIWVWGRRFFILTLLNLLNRLFISFLVLFWLLLRHLLLLILFLFFIGFHLRFNLLFLIFFCDFFFSYLFFLPRNIFLFFLLKWWLDRFLFVNFIRANYRWLFFFNLLFI